MSEETLELPTTAVETAPPAPVAKKAPPKKKAAKKPAAKKPSPAVEATDTFPPITLEKPIVIKKKPPVMHDHDQARLASMLRNRPFSPALVQAYFVKQREYHQRCPGPLPLEMLADLVFDVEKISVLLPAVAATTLNENDLGGGDRIARRE